MDETEERDVLAVALEWKAGLLGPVHPQVGRMLNRALVRARQDAVPLRRRTTDDAPTVAEMIRREHARASDALVRRMSVELDAEGRRVCMPVQEESHVGRD